MSTRKQIIRFLQVYTGSDNSIPVEIRYNGHTKRDMPDSQRTFLRYIENVGYVAVGLGLIRLEDISSVSELDHAINLKKGAHPRILRGEE